MSSRHAAGPPGRPGVGTRVRSLTASAALLGRRRARQDAGLLLALATLVALSTLLAVGGPRVVAGTVDAGVQDAVTAAGAASAVDVRSSVGAPGGGFTPALAGTEPFAAWAQDLTDRLPPGLAAVVDAATPTLVGPPAPLLARDGVPDPADDPDGQVELAVALVPAGLELVAGALPAERVPGAAADAPVEVVVSAAAADAAALDVGTRLTVAAPLGPLVADERAAAGLLVVGVVAPADAGHVAWEAVPETWSPVARGERSDRSAFTRLTALAAPDGVDRLMTWGSVFEGRVRLDVDPAAFTVARAQAVTAELTALRADAGELSPGPVTLRTGLDDALASYPPQARAALAQMSVMISGVVGVAGVVLVLLARLLVVRRGAVLHLERARGASAPAVGLRVLVESLVVTAAGVATGLLAAALLVPGPLDDVTPLVVVAGVALLAGPAQATWLVRRAWTGRREPANRQDRAQLARRRRVRRLVVEAGVVVLAAAATVALRGRGLLQGTTDGVDPFLAAGPVLVALAVTLHVLRVYPWPVRAAGALGARTRGVLGLLGAVRAQRAVAPLPLLALTLGMGLAVAGGLLVGTVRAGQEDASWDRVGADARVDDTGLAVPLDRVDDARDLPGATVASAKVTGGVSFSLGTDAADVTVLAVDDGYGALLAAAAGARDDEALAASAARDADALEALRGAAGTSGPVPALVDPDLAARVVGDGTALYLGASYIPVEVVGTVSGGPAGYLDGPYVYVDLEAVAARAEAAPEADTVWVVGDGTAAAVAALGVPPETVTTRAQWLEARRGGALLAGVERLMVLAVAAVCVLGTVALVATVLAGARERGRALSMLRTLGMSPRLGWWLALAELAPVVLAALLGGTLSGVLVVLVLAPALGLDVLAGGLVVPAPTVDADVIGGLAAGAALLLVLAVLAEVLAHRRDRLSEVLRVGETG
ncbi:FtsX-like permease family protein [Actinotalea solisilvae]|uniref:FtsX-like permease family protein n=1 Tax=Actinotalea solisilvae TaxID=2072922 RepID=UPI0018F145E5|nr:FtsX-like permease family protein [Actinotalea solisilvae]